MNVYEIGAILFVLAVSIPSFLYGLVKYWWGD